MAVLKLTLAPRLSLAVVQSDAQAVSFVVLGVWGLAVVVPAAAAGPRGYPWAF